MGTENRIELKFYQVHDVVIQTKNQNNQTETKPEFINNQTVFIFFEPNKRNHNRIGKNRKSRKINWNRTENRHISELAG